MAKKSKEFKNSVQKFKRSNRSVIQTELQERLENIEEEIVKIEDGNVNKKIRGKKTTSITPPATGGSSKPVATVGDSSLKVETITPKAVEGISKPIPVLTINTEGGQVSVPLASQQTLSGPSPVAGGKGDNKPTKEFEKQVEKDIEDELEQKLEKELEQPLENAVEEKIEHKLEGELEKVKSEREDLHEQISQSTSALEKVQEGEDQLYELTSSKDKIEALKQIGRAHV